MSDHQPVTPVPSATILLVRDGPSGVEVFMVKRHYQIDFASGALVFPGGKAAKGDYDAALADFTDCDPGWSAEMRALGAAAIREAFEESGILLVRPQGSDALLPAERLPELDRYRVPLNKGEIGLAEMLRAEKLRLACDRLVRFAHWITPKLMPKRFDTQFFLAAAPPGHVGSHDGHESVDSVWLTPQAAIEDRRRWSIMFPTKLNLMKLSKSKTVEEALAAARNFNIVPVEPWPDRNERGAIIRIRDDAGYDQTWTLASDVQRG